MTRKRDARMLCGGRTCFFILVCSGLGMTVSTWHRLAYGAVADLPAQEMSSRSGAETTAVARPASRRALPREHRRSRVAVSRSDIAQNPRLAAPALGALADFDKRCAEHVVIKCVGFDDISSISGGPGASSGITSGAATPVLDTTIKASGASSIRFTIPSNSGPDTSGSYFTNFSDDLSVQFGENQEFFVQWRQRFSSQFLSTHYEGGQGWKLAIVGTGDQPNRRYASCTALEIVVNSYYQSGFPVLYNSCTGSTSHGPYDGFYEPVLPYDFNLQNGRRRPYCLYLKKASSFFPPAGNCFGFVADEWMTFQLRVRTGPRVKDEFVNSYVTLWTARENRPSELVIDWGPYNLTAGNPADRQRFAKIWLLPYHTGKRASQAHVTAYTWYDELIISRARIPDPDTAVPAPAVKTAAASIRPQ